MCICDPNRELQMSKGIIGNGEGDKGNKGREVVRE